MFTPSFRKPSEPQKGKKADKILPKKGKKAKENVKDPAKPK